MQEKEKTAAVRNFEAGAPGSGAGRRDWLRLGIEGRFRNKPDWRGGLRRLRRRLDLPGPLEEAEADLPPAKDNGARPEISQMGFLVFRMGAGDDFKRRIELSPLLHRCAGVEHVRDRDHQPARPADIGEAENIGRGGVSKNDLATTGPRLRHPGLGVFDDDERGAPFGEAFGDRLSDAPYNTYTRAGLPPTPIAMPGLASLKAALAPADTSYLYFVARGDGSSHFSQGLDEHNQAVNKFQKGGKGP